MEDKWNMINYIKKIAKEIIKKEKCESGDVCYKSLSPSSDITNGKEYFEALDWALSQDDIQNIAISGPYGSGKSSTIESYIKNRLDIRNVLRISLAAFNLEKMIEENKEESKENNGDDKNETSDLFNCFDTKRLETAILKQLFYSVDGKTIPKSRYHKIQSEKNASYHVITLLAMVISLSLVLFFYHDNLIPFLDIFFSNPNLIGELLVFGLVLLIYASFYKIVEWIKNNGKIFEFSLLDKAAIRSSGEDKASVFDKNMDEIVYFFEQTKKRIVIIEDLDRFDNTNIFVALRELNRTLNNNDKSFPKGIKFIYAIKDDLFEKDIERTKFFDFIIPIVPYISSTNSYEILCENLWIDKESETSTKHNLTRDFIDQISPFISDMRVLTNICNEFVIYKNTLKINQDLGLDDQNMFALMVYKNLYPKEFAKMEEGNPESLVQIAFENKKGLIDGSRQVIDEKCNLAREKYEKIFNESLKNAKEVKTVALCALTNFSASIYAISTPERSYTIEEVLADGFDLTNLYNRRLSISANGNAKYRNFVIDDLENKLERIGDYAIRLKHISEGYQDYKEKLKEEIEGYERILIKLPSRSMKQVIEDFGIESFDQSVRDNELLVFMLSNGYLDDAYNNYINYFHPNSLNKEEMNFLIGIRNHTKGLGFSYKLQRTERLYKRLKVSDYMQEGILNFCLVDYLFDEHGYSNEMSALITQLSNHSVKSMDFITSYINRGSHAEELMIKLCKNNKLLWVDFTNYAGISLESLFEYLVIIMKNCDESDVVNLDVETKKGKVLTNFLIEHKDSLSRIDLVPVEKQIRLIEQLKLKFKDLEFKNLNPRLKEEIYYDNRYELNPNMIKCIFEWKEPELVGDLEVQNYTTILKSKLKELRDYISKEIGTYVDDVFLGIETNNFEDVSSMKSLFEQLLPSEPELCYEILNKEKTIWEDISECCSIEIDGIKSIRATAWRILVDKDLIKCSWDNYIKYFTECGYDSYLYQYFLKHNDELICELNKQLEADSVTDMALEALMLDMDSMSCFKKLIRCKILKPYRGELRLLSSEKLKLLIEAKLIPFSTSSWKELRELIPNDKSIYIDIYMDDFMKFIGSIKFSDDEICYILDSKEITNDNKIQVLSTVDPKAMTQELADTIKKADFLIDKKYSDSAMMFLDIEGKKRLIINQMSNFDNDELSDILPKIDEEFSVLRDRTRHRFQISYSDLNEKLCKKLLSCGYLTSSDRDPNNDQLLVGYVKNK